MSRRVVVTGLGAVTPIGNNVDDFWTSVKAGKIGFDHITKFDTTDYKCHIAAELKDFNPQDFMDRKAAKRMEPFSQYAVAAAKQAIDDSGLDIEKEDPYMVLSNAVSLYIRRIKEDESIVPSFNTFYEFVKTDYRRILEEKEVREKDFDLAFNYVHTLHI